MGENRWHKRVSSMTEETVLCCGQMGSRFAGTGRAIVTGCAVVDNPGVVKSRIGKICGVMTQHTILVCLDMIGRFATRNYTIMTLRTVINDVRMIKGTGGKSARRMTGTTVFRGGHVVV